MLKRIFSKPAVRIAIIALIAIAAIVVIIVFLRIREQQKMMLKHLIPSDSNMIESYNSMQSIISLPINDPYQQVRIVHIGDSHIQAGTITKKMRELLSAFVGEQKESEGYTFPYNLVNTNSPNTYTFESNAQWTFDKITINPEVIEVGLSGIYMETTTPNSHINVKLTSYASSKSSFNKIRIYYKNCEQSFVPQIADSLILSVTESNCYKEFTLNSELREIGITLAQTDKIQRKFHLTGLQIENCASKLVYCAAGLNGASAKSLLRASDLVEQIAENKPNLIIISLGTNDAYNDAFSEKKFADDLYKLVEKIKHGNPNSHILLTIPGDHYWMKEYSNPNLLSVREEIIKVAVQKECYTWDLFNIMGGSGSMKTWKEKGFASDDLIHFTAKGYNLQAKMLFEAITNYQPGNNNINIK